MHTRLLFCAALACASAGSLEAQSGRYLSAQFQPSVEAELRSYGANISVLPVVLGRSQTPQLDTLEYRLVTPGNDDATNRPVVIIHHTGSYMPIALNGGLTGNINDGAVQELAQRFAAFGYVVVTPEYRQGWNTIAPDVDEQTETLLIASLRGAQDMHMMTRYLRKTVEEDGNPLGIDPSRIMAIGLGTGGYNVLNANFLDRVSEVNDLDKFIDSRDNLPYYDSTLYGNPYGTDRQTLNVPNWPAYESGFAFGVNVGGAMGDEAWIEGKASEAPVAAMHSIVDRNAPFDLGNISVPTTRNVVLQDAPGSRRIVQVATEAGGNQLRVNAVHAALVAQNNPISLRIEQLESVPYTTTDGTETTLAFDNMYPFVYAEDARFANEYNYTDTSVLGPLIRPVIAAAQLPFTFEQLVQGELASNRNFLNPAGARTYLDTIMAFVLPRAYAVMNLDALVGVEDLAVNVDLEVSPNPANGAFAIEVRDDVVIERAEIFNASGQLLHSASFGGANRVRVEAEGLPAGIHVLFTHTSEGVATSKLVIE